LFWAINAFKQRQEDFPASPLTKLKGPFPSPEKAGAEFVDAMDRADLERAEPALVALARHRGARQTVEQLWPFGCRNGNAGGHGAISVANCFRALDTIGWQEAEPVLRFVVQDLFNLGYAKPDAHFAPNSARVERHLDKLPGGWAGEKGDRAATLELFALIREGKAVDVCDLATKQLRGGTSAQAIWDAVHLATSELMVRHRDGWGLASRPLHSGRRSGRRRAARHGDHRAVWCRRAGQNGGRRGRHLRATALPDLPLGPQRQGRGTHLRRACGCGRGVPQGVRVG
jgi:hypothetical protein